MAIAIFLYVTIINNQYRNRIPEIPESFISLTVEEQITEAYNEAHDNPTANNMGKLGMVYHSSAMYDQATRCYQLAIQKNKSEWKWSYYLGYLNMELGNSNEVVENFNRVIKVSPDVDFAWYYLGEAYRNLGKYDLAEEAFLKVLNSDNISASGNSYRSDHFSLGIYAMYQISKIYYETKRLDLAEETLKKLMVENDLFGPAYRLLGNVYSMKGNVSLAEEYSVKANDLLHYSPPVDGLVDELALMSRSELYLLKKIDEAERTAYRDWSLALVEQGLKYIPDNKHLLSKAIKIYLWKNMNQKAIDLMDQHIASFDDNFGELGMGGMLFYKMDMCEQAIKYWVEALKLKTEDADLYENLAFCYWKTGDKPKAEETLTNAVKIYQDDPENLAVIAYAFFRIENEEKAAAYLKRLRQVAPNNSNVQKLAGKIAEYNGDVNEAMAMYKSSFEGNPKDIETIHELGDIFAQKKMWKNYIGLYKEAATNNPNNAEILEKLSTIMLGCPDKSLRNLDEGLEYSKRAFISISSTPQVMLTSGKNLAVAYATKGDKQNAINTIKKTIQFSEMTNASQDLQKELRDLYGAIQSY